ncbi:uncharacterized protein I206_103372 [Kwoniella pini CBS 10737]|uniref:Uncharacterized protein n=1 Tax=Kwoniella pini CBS 10737 TaxID=1296096 RepID=A0AAJ8L4I6_9TREE
MKPSIVDKKIVLDGLRSLPEDTSILDPPNVTQEQASYFTRELLAFVEERQSQAARHTVLQAASNLSPEPVWENTALQWSQNADRTGAGNDRIITYIIKGFKEGVFQPELWLQGLENETKDNEVSKEILVAWGKDNFDVSVAFKGGWLTNRHSWKDVQGFTRVRPCECLSLLYS